MSNQYFEPSDNAHSESTIREADNDGDVLDFAGNVLDFAGNVTSIMCGSCGVYRSVDEDGEVEVCETCGDDGYNVYGGEDGL
jgi:hypothetical protein